MRREEANDGISSSATRARLHAAIRQQDKVRANGLLAASPSWGFLRGGDVTRIKTLCASCSFRFVEQ